ncbi:MAG: hydrogenase iron-sulfur subunit [Thermoproteota archaeon]
MSEEPRIGVFVCHCGKNIGGVVDVIKVTEYAKTLPNVVYASHNLYTCSDAGQAEIKRVIKEYGLNRVVVAACSPKMHEPTFRACVSEAGLNPYLFEMANIREHCSWVHASDPEGATRKAMDLVKMAVAKAKLLEPLEPIIVPVEKTLLVIGGGLAGMRAALDVAESGYGVILVEKSPRLGGKTAMLGKTFPKVDCTACLINEMISRVLTHPGIRVLTLSEVTSVDGYVGNFIVTVKRRPSKISEECIGCGKCVETCPVEVEEEFSHGLSKRKAIYLVEKTQGTVGCEYGYEKAMHIHGLVGIPLTAVIDDKNCIKCGKCIEACPFKAIDLEVPGLEETFKVGAIILATGFDLFDPVRKPEYGYGRLRNVLTSMEFEKMLTPNGPTNGKIIRPSDNQPVEKIAFIQCVGCRDEATNIYCSRICCMITLKQALLVKRNNPNIDVTVFYIDIRAGGKEYETIFRMAREAGIRFIRGRPDSVREENGMLVATAEDTLSGERVEAPVDIIVLAVGMQPSEGADKLGEMLRVPRDQYGFFMEAHIKLKPVETVVNGIFLAGSCAGPTDIPMTVARGHAAASKTLMLFSKDFIELEPITSYVDPMKCKGCLACTKMCPYQALKPVEKEGRKLIQVTQSMCAGCGTCAAGCPFEALNQYHFTTEQIIAQIDAALEENPQDKIISFCCNWCSYAGSDFAGVSRLEYPSSVRIIRVMCSGRVSEKMILRAFEKGTGMVLVAPCHPADCHYISGNEWARRRVEALKKKLGKMGINPERLWFVYVSAAEGNVYQNTIIKMHEYLQKLKNGEISWGAEEAASLVSSPP